MSTHKSIDQICMVIIAITLIIALIFCNGNALGIEMSVRAIGYENRIFDQSAVHTIDIVMDDWDGFIATCENEEYIACSVVIDGEAFKNVGIRVKGNTSLTSVSRMDSSRYSFKIEFDHYDRTTSYHGLDKLCLNNIIQDNTYMKDYLAYTLMGDFGVASPLCSYAYITVNGEDWGLYLAVEGVEEAFLQRNYGNNYGELYKPDSMSFGGGRGNGRDFNMSDFFNQNSDESDRADADNRMRGFSPQGGFGRGGMQRFGDGNMPEGMEIPDNLDFSEIFGENGMEFPADFDFSEMFGENGEMPNFGNMRGMAGGMGSSDVKLQYIDDDFDSYSNIFNNAKTTISDTDKTRLINSLKMLSEETDVASAVDVEKVIRYFVVHNFLCNGDSYTGSMVHNYYLYEKNGQLSMIPWDYNLAFGTFQGTNASSAVNEAIDTPVSGDMSDRPMVSWIFDDEAYTELYHELFSEFISETDFASLVEYTAEMIAEYVEQDPTKFCTYEEFEAGVTAISNFCQLRAESVQGQLDGTIPSTSDGQSADSSALIDTSSLNVSDMGTMNHGGFGGLGNFNRFGKNQDNEQESSAIPNTNNMMMQPPNGVGGQMPDDFNREMPEGFDPSAMFGGDMPEGFDGNRPGGAGGNMPGGFGSSDNQVSSDDESDNADRNSFRSSMNNFPSMNGNPQTSTNPLPLLGVSVGVLIIGLVVAFKFKR